MDKNQVLKDYFGHDRFRPGQEALIDGLLAGRDVMGIMPTGGGKSLCYQVPALLLEGVALVISPLISLMKDQVMALKALGIPAAYLNSSLSLEQQDAVCRRLEEGAYRILYVAPERLETESFLSAAQRLPLSLVAVDEAHCISQWGQDFRPSYLKIKDFLEGLPHRPAVGAFTATATQAVREDILRLLELRDPVCQVTGFDRPNLYFDVLRPKRKDEALSRLLCDRVGKSGIVYCATRAAVDQVCQALRDQGVAATRYHAGLPEQERRQNQEDFQYDRCPVMVATNAFGMGIDKSNVSFVIHYNMPKSLEAYYQEAGRAGRDGSPADCILLYSPGDVTTAQYLLQHSGENDALTPQERAEVARQDARRLEAMVGYCKTTDCLRGYLLDYFGQEHEDNCGSCGNCRGMFALEDVTVPAQMILSCVRRIYDALGYDLGAGLVIQVLRGSRSQRVRELGLDRLSTYGLMKQVPRERVQTILDFLESRGYLRTHPVHRGMHLTGKAREVLFDGVRVEMPVRLTAPAPKKGKEKPVPRPAPETTGLFGVLKALRTRLAQKERVPAYIIFTNATLEDMAARCPRTLAEMGEVSGVGQKKLEKYGEIFLRAIAEYEKG